MNKADILAELPRLSPQERREIFETLWRMEEASGPTAREEALLNEAQAAFEANPEAGESWAQVEARLRQR